MELFTKKNNTNTNTSKKSRVNKNKIIALSRVSVQFDWFIGLSVFVIVFIVVIVLSVFQYFSLTDTSISASNTVAQDEIIDSKQLDRVVVKYAAKAARFAELVPNFKFNAVGSAESFYFEELEVVEIATTTQATSSTGTTTVVE